MNTLTDSTPTTPAKIQQWSRPSASALAMSSAVAALVVATMLTPGFASLPNIIALSGTISLIGCIAVGMTFITLSGNIMSFALGATCAATSMIVAHFSDAGFFTSVGIGIVFSVAVTGAQGILIGVFRANPLIVSIASLSLLLGVAHFAGGGQSIYVRGDTLALLKIQIFGLPISAVIFLAAVFAGELVLRFTSFGQKVFFVGSNPDAAIVAGVNVWRTVTASYVTAGFFTALAGVLMAARFGSGNMEFGVGYDYSAISAVLVGGTAIGGGRGSVLRTCVGVVFIAVLQSLLLLHGLPAEYQYLLIGLIVLGAVLLQAKGRSS